MSRLRSTWQNGVKAERTGYAGGTGGARVSGRPAIRRVRESFDAITGKAGI